MWQCIICEDWYHTKHLNAEDLPTKFDEMICGQCVEKLDFVHHYKSFDHDDDKPTSSLTASEQRVGDRKTQDLASGEQDELHKTSDKADLNSESKTQLRSSMREDQNKIPLCESDTNDSQVENKDPDFEKASSSNNCNSECVLERLKMDPEKSKSDSSITKRPIFWSDCDWRSKLCRCQRCLEMYKIKECEYLLDDKDTVQYYEAQGKALAKNHESPFERGMSALNRMNRAAVVEALHGYDELKANLSDYLRKFADTKKVVREEDIHEFFQQLKSKKRPRLEYE